jgi:hypothetical protein
LDTLFGDLFEELGVVLDSFFGLCINSETKFGCQAYPSEHTKGIFLEAVLCLPYSFDNPFLEVFRSVV